MHADQLAHGAVLQAYSWGGNEYGQCAQEEEEVLVPAPCLPHLRVRQVAAGGMHSCVLTTSGEVPPALPSCVLLECGQVQFSCAFTAVCCPRNGACCALRLMVSQQQLRSWPIP